jgi:hypothetical protein
LGVEILIQTRNWVTEEYKIWWCIGGEGVGVVSGDLGEEIASDLRNGIFEPLDDALCKNWCCKIDKQKEKD